MSKDNIEQIENSLKRIKTALYQAIDGLDEILYVLKTTDGGSGG